MGDFTAYLDRVLGFHHRGTQPLLKQQPWRERPENGRMNRPNAFHLQFPLIPIS
ncbi:MAG: hypothetical protein F6K54_04745 [Okeania sp. SIO3B5]|uniref:hypothetical protein n=1 Tax=Okeania sp. SIO3B5 TaxID=2607811 RepID=UPI0013FF2A7F|nr:hypothetical protein [Okeania sp. SIO3B5]NEO52442.1 hypothetical protein [Okeania sp. SIO3B5]